MLSELSFKKIVVIGAGLMGGSLIKALTAAKIAEQIIAIVRKEEDIAKLSEIGIKASCNLLEEAKNADIIFIATPLSSYQKISDSLKGNIREDAIITDVGSVKSGIANIFSEFNFVATHPIAGSNIFGAGNIIDDLFNNEKLIITSDASQEKVQIIANIWQQIGSQIIFMNEQEHDRIYALVSHFPHKISFAFVNLIEESGSLNDLLENNETLQKFTRIAASSKKMWEDIFSFNAPQIKEVEIKFRENITQFTDFIEKDKAILLNSAISEIEGLFVLEKSSPQLENQAAAIIMLALLSTLQAGDLKFIGSGFRDMVQIINDFDHQYISKEKHKISSHIKGFLKHL